MVPVLMSRVPLSSKFRFEFQRTPGTTTHYRAPLPFTSFSPYPQNSQNLPPYRDPRGKDATHPSWLGCTLVPSLYLTLAQAFDMSTYLKV
eukprot:754554-Hanusia_phi.AAC.1